MVIVNVSISISNKSSSLIFYLQKKAIAFKEFQHFFERLLPNLPKNHILKVFFQLWFKTCFCKNRIQKGKQKCLTQRRNFDISAAKYCIVTNNLSLEMYLF